MYVAASAAGADRAIVGLAEQPLKPVHTHDSRYDGVDSMSREITGILELAGEARGFIRDPKTNYRIKPSDPIVPRAGCARRPGLRGGETIAGTVREGGRNGRSSAPEVAEIHLVNNRPVEERLEMKPFEELTAIDPDQAVRFETRRRADVHCA